MTRGREVEFKYRIDSERELDQLVGREGGHAAAAVRQINHFFDTENGVLDARPHHTLRLREEAGGYLLTAKGPARRSAKGTLSARDETNRRIEADDARMILDGSRSALDVLETHVDGSEPLLDTIRHQIGTRSLHHVGSFTNYRASVPVLLDVEGKRQPYVLEIDRTEFPGGRVEREVEVEVQATLTARELDVVALAIRDHLRRVGIVEIRSASGKARRLFDTLAGRKA